MSYSRFDRWFEKVVPIEIDRKVLAPIWL